MEIQLSQEASKFGTSTLTELQTGMPQKIVVIRSAVGSELVYIFPVHIEHINAVRSLLKGTTNTLLAAGHVWPPCGTQTEPVIAWDSNTCRDAIGYDQPKDSTDATRIASSVADEVKRLLKNERLNIK